MFAQGTLSPVPQQVFLDGSGNLLNNAKICTYAAGTLTPLATYSDVTLTTANANPIRTSSAGRPTTGGIYLSPTSYKFILLTAGSDNTCSTGTTIYTQDNVTAVPTTSSALDVTGTAGEALVLGDAVCLSDGTIGTAGRWFKSDADFTYASSTAGMCGMATAVIASGSSGSIRIQGRLTGLSALTAGEFYYASATAGALTATPPTNARFLGQADTTTSLVVGGNPGAVRMPDSDGTHNYVARTASNLTADRLINFNFGDVAATFDQSVATTAAPTFNYTLPCQGRLTLTSGTPVTTGDVTAAGTLYFTPFRGNQCWVYDGSASWVLVTFNEISLAITCTAANMYDVWVYSNAGVLTLETLIWTNTSTRATALATQNGKYVKTGATTRLYVGSFYCTASNQTEDSFAKRAVWNYYNRVPRPGRVTEATNTWTYTLASYQQANNSTANQILMVVGVAEVPVALRVSALGRNDAASREIGVAIGDNSTTTAIAGQIKQGTAQQANNLIAPVSASITFFPAVGLHNFTWLEISEAAGTTTWVGDNGGTMWQSGIEGWIEG